MDKSSSPSWEFLPTGDRRCEKCGSVEDVEKFDGAYLCKDCRQQRAAMI